eukprot:COSAG01_NODE_342_length_18601_cov_43.546319_18_plen_51_part_00
MKATLYRESLFVSFCVRCEVLKQVRLSVSVAYQYRHLGGVSQFSHQSHRR